MNSSHPPSTRQANAGQSSEIECVIHVEFVLLSTLLVCQVIWSTVNFILKCVTELNGFLCYVKCCLLPLVAASCSFLPLHSFPSDFFNFFILSLLTLSLSVALPPPPPPPLSFSLYLLLLLFLLQHYLHHLFSFANRSNLFSSFFTLSSYKT